MATHRRALPPRALARTCGRGMAQAGTRLGHTPHPGIGARQWVEMVLHQGGIYHQHGTLAPHSLCSTRSFGYPDELDSSLQPCVGV